MEQPAVVGIGSKENHDSFLKRHAKFFSQLTTLTEGENVVFARTLSSSDILSPIIFYLGIRSVHDFNAIVLLAAHGQALPANALVRGMYERVATAAYLRQNPEEAPAFANYDYVQRFKAARVLRDTVGLTPDEEQGFQQLQKEYENVKPDFMVTDCKKCGTKTLGPGWSKLDFVNMTKKVPPLDHLLAGAYYLPLLQAHSTLKSISSMLHRVEGELVFKTDYTALCDAVFKLAYLLLMHVFKIQALHFHSPEIEKAAESVINDYVGIYPNTEDAPGCAS
jgi:Family of unknown function (DUF5677)